MSRVVLLDAGPLGRIAHPRRTVEVTLWLHRLLQFGVDVVIPEIADYEVRRELLRINAAKGIERLDTFKTQLRYAPLTTEVMLLAAEYWVHVRRWLSMYTDTVKENTAADTICLIGDTAHIFEFKGITEGTELDQYRNTVAKLYEYRYRMASKDRRYTDAYLWMVLSGPLHRPWIVDYLTGDRQIGVLWIEGKAVGGPSLAAFERIARAVTPAPSKP